MSQDCSTSTCAATKRSAQHMSEYHGAPAPAVFDLPDDESSPKALKVDVEAIFADSDDDDFTFDDAPTTLALLGRYTLKRWHNGGAVLYELVTGKSPVALPPLPLESGYGMWTLRLREALHVKTGYPVVYDTGLKFKVPTGHILEIGLDRITSTDGWIVTNTYRTSKQTGEMLIGCAPGLRSCSYQPGDRVFTLRLVRLPPALMYEVSGIEHIIRDSEKEAKL